MKENTEQPPISIWGVIAVLTACGAFYLSTFSPFVLILPVLYLASLVLPYRFERDAGSIWGLRLLVYAGFAILGRAPTGAPGYFVDSQAFTTAGLIAGGELVLQSFRQPPKGARFDPWIVSLSGVIFLIACNSFRDHIWYLAPLYMMSLLLSLADLRPRAASKGGFSGIRRALTILVAVVMGAGLHQMLWAYRGSIMSMGARFLSNQNSATQTPGVADNPSLSSSFAAGSSTARFLRITGSLNDPKLRAAAFDVYQNGSWGPALSRRFSGAATLQSALPKETGEVDKEGQDIPRNKTDAKIVLLRESGGVLFAPLNAAALMPSIGESFNWDRYQGPFVTEEPAPVTYYVVNSKQEKYDFQVQQGPMCIAPNRFQRADLLRIPNEIDPEVVALARRIARTGTTQSEKASMIINYLFKTNKYSLEFVRGAQDPVSDFVLNKKAAHCQYFASAATMMLRAVGIPARYVTGYYAHEPAEDGTTIVRGRDAHAWTEAYLNNMGWVALDATPPSGRADPAVSPSPWYEESLEKTQDNFARVRAWFGNLTQLQIFGIVVVVMVLWGLERWRQALKKARKRDKGPIVPPEFAPLARRFERVLSKRGIKMASDKPWSETVPEELEGEREWIEGYNRARFDDKSDSEVRELEKELQKLEK
jgi:transglutaminase-like putative cysteine protease